MAVNKQTKTGNDFAYLKNAIILDTGSTIPGTFMNKDLVKNIKLSPRPITMKTNGGSKTMTMEGTVGGFGKAYFDPSQMANLFGFAHLVDKNRITYDSDVEDAFLMHFKNGVVKFK